MSETFTPITEGVPRFGAIIITASGRFFQLHAVETIETDKQDNGDAGTWSMSLPLALNLDVASVIAPMDLVALYAYRASVDVTGAASDPVRVFRPKVPMIAHLAVSPSSTYGAPDAATTKTLATSSCVMIGMVDSVEESYDYEGPRFMLNLSGRDLTKVFIDNDTLVPETVDGGKAFTGIGSLVLNARSYGTDFLLNVFDTFVAKNPASVQAIAGNDKLDAAELAAIAKYGYPWRNFIDTTTLLPYFKYLAGGELPSYMIQRGSAWANVEELRNFPIARLFVNELGQLIFDDTWTAWGYGADLSSLQQGPLLTVDNADVRRVDFRMADDDVVTSLSLANTWMQGANVAMSGLVQFGAQRTSPTIQIARYGYRYQTFTSTYDPLDSFYATARGTETAVEATSIADAKFPILWQLHNDLWVATFTLKGDAKWKVGQRLATTLYGSQKATQPPANAPKYWYIIGVRHNMNFGSDWTTTVTARFPLDVYRVNDATLSGTPSSVRA